MENAKQKAIRLAYVNLIGEEKYNQIKMQIDENGRLKIYDVKLIGNLPTDFEVLDNVYVRPKSLQGIENNNGWIKIESEKDLPSDDCDCYIEFLDGSISISKYFSRERNFLSVHWKHVIAFQIVIKPKQRIY